MEGSTIEKEKYHPNTNQWLQTEWSAGWADTTKELERRRTMQSAKGSQWTVEQANWTQGLNKQKTKHLSECLDNPVQSKMEEHVREKKFLEELDVEHEIQNKADARQKQDRMEGTAKEKDKHDHETKWRYWFERSVDNLTNEEVYEKETESIFKSVTWSQRF